MTTPEEFPPPGPADPGAGYPPPPGGPSSGYGAAQGYGAPGQQSGYGAATGMPPLASWGARLGAVLLDLLVVYLPLVILAGIAGAAGLRIVVALIYLALAAAGIVLAYRTGTTGQTPGKRMVGIRVLREADGQVLGGWLGVGRAFLHVVDQLPCYVGYLWPLWDAKKQTFADKIVSSVVVRG